MGHAVSPARQKIDDAMAALADLEAAARGFFERDGGLAAHLDCRVHPPCDEPGGPGCECIGRMAT
jgi:hypothetical protein